jgi:hypothetical protein
MITGRRGERVPARAADPECADPLRVDHVTPGRQTRHRGLEVLGAMRGVLQAARLALALPLAPERLAEALTSFYREVDRRA